jgi:hypothetical protein
VLADQDDRPVKARASETAAIEEQLTLEGLEGLFLGLRHGPVPSLASGRVVRPDRASDVILKDSRGSNNG